MALSSLPISSVARPMKLTISPTSACPRTCRIVPSTTMEITAIVLAARVITLTTAHQVRTGNWCWITRCTMSPNSLVSAARRVKLCTTITFAKASCAVPASSNWYCWARRCPASVLRTTRMVTAQNSNTSTIRLIASRQLRNSVSGSSTSTVMKVDSWSRKKLSQSQNIASAPDSMVLIMRPECDSP
jgi:hypothetical protein